MTKIPENFKSNYTVTNTINGNKLPFIDPTEDKTTFEIAFNPVFLNYSDKFLEEAFYTELYNDFEKFIVPDVKENELQRFIDWVRKAGKS